MNGMNKYIKYLRVSTLKQGSKGLGMQGQSEVIDYFTRDGLVMATFSEVYTGTNLSGCTELRKAIDLCKKENAKLVIYKSDRFRNVKDALSVMDELGEGNLICCDIPNQDRFTLTLFFAIAEREALLNSIRTKLGLKVLKDNITKNGYHTSKRTGEPITKLGNPNIAEVQQMAADAAGEAHRERKEADEEWQKCKKLAMLLRGDGKSYKEIYNTLNGSGIKTRTGGNWGLSSISRLLNG